MRYLVALVVLLAAAAGGVLIYLRLTAGPPVVLPRPAGLETSVAGTPLLPGGWTNSSSISLGVLSTKGVVAGADVEVRRLGARFTNSPTISDLHARSGDPVVQAHLPDGAYRWQGRLHNQQGVSPWMVYRGAVRIDTRPPALAQISSPTDPKPGKTYHSSTMRFMWQDADLGASGLAGYSYRLDADPHGAASTELRTGDTAVTLNGLDTGTWYFHVRALDHAGNWGPTATFPVRIDVTPPGLAHVRFSRFHFDPQFNTLRVSFGVTRPTLALHVGVYRQSDGGLVRYYQLSHLAKGQTLGVVWDGKDRHGRPVAQGNYEVYIRAIDRYGHSSLTGWRDFVVDYRHIVVSLSQQRLWAYDGNHVVLSSLVTTGNRALPTPRGTFDIMARLHPFTFISPWPKTSPYYYKPSKVQYAMLFREGGYFIHDAPWRSAFGPGTNAALGTPGTNYTGTHGCINVPPDVAQRLFNWVEIGTVVQVVA